MPSSKTNPEQHTGVASTADHRPFRRVPRTLAGDDSKSAAYNGAIIPYLRFSKRPIVPSFV